MALLEAKRNALPLAKESVFQPGKFEVHKPITVKKSDSSAPPAQLLIITPKDEGTYPVLLFCHGFLLDNTWYSQLLTHISSHGYIVVAPEFYTFFNMITIDEETKLADRVVHWLSEGLSSVLPPKVSSDLSKLALSGHSRGGKTAFCVALKDNEKPSPKFCGLIGIDPVAGGSVGGRTDPKILTYVPRAFKQKIPVAVIGTGLGDQPKWFIPPFAPDGVNHAEFYNESEPPVWYFRAKDYGHCDMLDDYMEQWYTKVCASGGGKKTLMRRGVGGIVVAFLEACLEGQTEDLDDIVATPSIAPIELDPVIYVAE